MPYKQVKFNKHKHRKTKWITDGFVRSIQFRDRLHYRLRNRDVSDSLNNTLENDLKTYNKILKS